ncbi:MAG TPA: hypothetical protein VGP86_00970, partial [Xanthobacteraceae bacterium]|nr:hypothetical protein [Xanthobacteraceae bacterium]
MLIRLILDPDDEHRSGANQINEMRQWFSFQEHSKRGNAASHPVCRAATLDVRGFAFRAAGRQPIDLGWRAAFPDWQPAAETGDDAQLLPAFCIASIRVPSLYRGGGRVSLSSMVGFSVSLRGRPPFRDWRNDRGLGLSISAGDGKCPQARLWAQV